MYGLNTLRHSPVKEIIRNGVTSGLILALMGGNGLPVHAQQESMPPAGAIVNNEGVVPTEESPALNMHDDYYTMEENTYAQFKPFENDEMDWVQIGLWRMTISPGPGVNFPWKHDVDLVNHYTEWELTMTFPYPEVGEYTFTLDMKQKDGPLSDTSVVHLNVVPKQEQLTLLLPNIQNTGVANE